MNKTFIDISMGVGFCFAFFLSLVCLNMPVFSQIQKSAETWKVTAIKVPRIERGDCAVPIPANEKADCGYLIVYEDRQANKGRTIRLPFITMKSESANPLPDPVLYTGGGPGGSSLGQAETDGTFPT
jgi:hypothetical protein